MCILFFPLLELCLHLSFAYFQHFRNSLGSLQNFLSRLICIGLIHWSSFNFQTSAYSKHRKLDQFPGFVKSYCYMFFFFFFYQVPSIELQSTALFLSLPPFIYTYFNILDVVFFWFTDIEFVFFVFFSVMPPIFNTGLPSVTFTSVHCFTLCIIKYLKA